MTEQTIEKSGHFYIKAFLLILIPTVIARVSGFFYSYTATDIIYADTLLPDILRYSSLIFTCAAQSASYTAICSAVYMYTRKKGTITFLFASGVYLLDCAARFLIDYADGLLSKTVALAILQLCASFVRFTLSTAVVLMFAFALERAYLLRRRPKKLGLRAAVNIAVIFGFAVVFVQYLYTGISFLIDVEWIPTDDEIVSLVTDGITIVAGYLFASFAVSRFALLVIRKKKK